eukprot:384907_1
MYRNPTTILSLLSSFFFLITAGDGVILFPNTNNMFNGIFAAGNSTEQLISLGKYNTLKECQMQFESSNNSYRSFIYYSSNFTVNSSWTNYCYVRTDTFWSPTPQLNVISGQINNFYQCINDFDCELNGKCINTHCQCKPMWTGNFCQYLHFKTKNNYKTLGYQRTNYSSWGGSTFYDKYLKIWNMFVAEMCNNCGINSCCANNSRIIRAISKNPGGPYQFDSIVKPYFSHEPNIVYSKKDNLYLLYHWGNADKSVILHNNCSEGYTNGPTVKYGNYNDENNDMVQYNYISYSDTLYNDSIWQNNVNMIPIPGQNSSGDLCPSNPYIFENGSVLMFWIERWQQPVVALNRNSDSKLQIHLPPRTGVVHIMNSNAWNETYDISWNRLWISNVYDQSSLEDPFVWRDKSDGSFHALMHGMIPYNMSLINGSYEMVWWGKSQGRHAYSLDGISWILSPHYTYNSTICYSDGDCIDYGRRERPHLIFDPETNEAIYLTNGVQLNQDWYYDKTFTSAVPLYTSKDI